jgi:hypothetical protein
MRSSPARSHAQVRFSDAALVALKPDSEFRIETFDFSATASGNERAVFRLVRGGFRTVTGTIGQINQDRYQVLTTQATIGIRGTHYALQICAPAQCVSQGTTARAGLYGGVFDGIVAVGNPFGTPITGPASILLSSTASRRSGPSRRRISWRTACPRAPWPLRACRTRSSSRACRQEYSRPCCPFRRSPTW